MESAPKAPPAPHSRGANESPETSGTLVLPVACEAASGGATARCWRMNSPNRLFHGLMRGPLCHRRYTSGEDAVSFYVRRNCSGDAGGSPVRRGHFREAHATASPLYFLPVKRDGTGLKGKRCAALKAPFRSGNAVREKAGPHAA